MKCEDVVMRKHMSCISNIDLKFEFKTFKNIGKLNKIKEQKYFFCKQRVWLKKITNKKEKRYKNFDSFSQWEKYIQKKFKIPKEIKKKDYLFFLERDKHEMQMSCDMLGIIVIPIYAVLLSMGAMLMGNTEVLRADENRIDMAYAIYKYLLYGFGSMTIIILLTLIFLLAIYCGRRKKIFFYNNLIVALKNKY